MLPFSIAHLTDLHIAPSLPSPERDHIKRWLSRLSWNYSRKHQLNSEICDALIADVLERKPDHIAITGDVVNFSMPQEFRAAVDLFERMGGASRVSVVPGNHDDMIAGDAACRDRLWGQFMKSDSTEAEAGIEFPYYRRLGPVGLIGVSSACPTPIFYSGGQIGHDQIERLAKILEAARAEGAFRVILIHHPPLANQAGRRKQLFDAEMFGQVIARCGAELILHGHLHRHQDKVMAGADGDVRILGLPAASSKGTGGWPVAHYAIDEITQVAKGWHRRRMLYSYQGKGKKFAPVGEDVEEIER